MDAYEATKVVLQRIQTLDPENASKIMGFLLIQDHGEKEMIRLAFGSESLLQSVIVNARKELGLSRQNSSSATPSRLLGGVNRPSPLTIAPHCPASWAASNSPDFQTPDALVSGGGELDLMDEFQLQDQLSFLNDGSLPYAGWTSGGGGHRRSFSVSDTCLGSDDPSGGFGWKPCLYFARGYCKNGTSCRFLHGSAGEASDSVVGSPGKLEMMEQCQELLRSKSALQQRLSADFPYSAKCMNFLLQRQHLQVQSPRAAAAALMMSNTMHKLSRAYFERGDFGVNCARQIYLTFPADSTFKEEDVSNYFSNFGPVQDVRIPYQQKRMFGFVTFVYPETVKMILAKGNPHFVCDSRVLVKPYKEKGKVPEKFRKQQEQIERGEFTGCGSPTGLETVDPCDIPLRARMLYNTQDMLWRGKLEAQADLQQAIELESRRLMNLQFLDAKRSNHHRTQSTGAVFPSPTHSPGFVDVDPMSFVIPENGSGPKVGNNGDEKSAVEKDAMKSHHNEEDNHFPESLEHNLPDSPFASPKAAGNSSITAFLIDSKEVEKGVAFSEPSNNNPVSSTPFPDSTSADVTPFSSCYFRMSRSPSGQGTIVM